MLSSWLSAIGHRRLIYANIVHHRRAEDGYVKAWKQAEHQGKDKLDADLRRPLFGILSPLGPRDFRMRAQCLRDAGPEPVGLHEHRNQRSDLVNFRPRGSVLEGLDP